MDSKRSIYPDVSDILKQKAEGRRDSAKMSFGDKLLLLDSLRDRLEPFRAAREARRSQATAPRG